jgi:hypothetical protein
VLRAILAKVAGSQTAARRRRRLVARVTALLVALPFLAFASALAPEHVHEPGPGHEHAIAHSHLAPHAIGMPHSDDGNEIEHDIEHVVYLDSPMLCVSAVQIVPALSAIPVSYEAVLTLTPWTVIPSEVITPAHGPPRRHVLFRGPPALLV